MNILEETTDTSGILTKYQKNYMLVIFLNVGKKIWEF